MKLFEFNAALVDEDLQFIWDELNTLGKIYFSQSRLKSLWESFSDDVYCAGFMIPSEELVEEFAHWLVFNEDKL